MTTVFFGGAEAPTHRNRLLHAGARAVSIGLLDLWPRLPSTGRFDVGEHVDDGVRVLLDLQGAAANRRALPPEEAAAYVEAILPVIYENRDRIDGVVEFDYEPWGLEGMLEGRAAFFDNLPVEKFLPVWRPHWGQPFAELAEKYSRVAVTADVLKGLTTAESRRLRKTALTDNVSLHGLGTSDQTLAVEMRLDSLSFSSWIAASSQGETTLWEGNRIRRYRSKDKEEVRIKKRSLIERVGVDPDEVLAEDPQALTTLAVAAWQEWADHTDSFGSRSGQPKTESFTTDLQPASESPVQPTRYKWNGEAPEGMTLLPFLSTEKSQHGDGYELDTSASSMRRCGTCSLAGLCPAEVDPEEEDDRCRVAIPVEIRDKSQLVATLRTFVELQAQRALFAKMGEDVTGAGASSDVSAEFDRFMRMTQQMKEVLEDREFLSVKIEASGGNTGGVLSRLFGSAVGEQARAIDPTDADEVIAEVLDG